MKNTFNKNRSKTKQIIIKRMRIKFEIKIKRNQMLKDATKKQIQLTKWLKQNKKGSKKKYKD